MTNISKQLQAVREGRAFICERLTTTDPSREQAMLNAAKILSRELSLTLQYDWKTEQQVELTESGISNWMARLDQLQQSGIDCVYGLRNHPFNPTVFFYWSQTPSRCPKKELLQCTIPYEIALELLIKIFSTISPYF